MTVTARVMRMVNTQVDDVEFDVDSSAAYQELRQLWTMMPRVPKLIDATTAPVVLAHGGQTIHLALKGRGERRVDDGRVCGDGSRRRLRT